QPPLTPLLGRVGTTLFGDNVVALRVPAALAAMATVLLAGLVARELGGRATAQTIAAASFAVSGLLVAAHLLSTTTIDILAWAALGFVFVRLLRTEDTRLWLVFGLVLGVALLNKYLVLDYVVSLLAGLVLARRWRLLASRH